MFFMTKQLLYFFTLYITLYIYYHCVVIRKRLSTKAADNFYFIFIISFVHHSLFFVPDRFNQTITNLWSIFCYKNYSLIPYHYINLDDF